LSAKRYDGPNLVSSFPEIQVSAAPSSYRIGCEAMEAIYLFLAMSLGGTVLLVMFGAKHIRVLWPLPLVVATTAAVLVATQEFVLTLIALSLGVGVWCWLVARSRRAG